MKKYWQFLVIGYTTQWMYRGSMIIQGLRDGVTVLFFILLWSALFKEKAEIGGFTFQAMITYYILTKVIDQIYSYEPSRLFTRDVITGDLSNYLAKPLKYFLYLMTLALGRRFARVTTSLILMVAVFIFLPQWVAFPPSVVYFFVFIISAILSWLLLFEFAFLLGTMSFWTSSTGGVRTAFEQLTLVLGGLWVPLNLFPKQIADVLALLPFRYLYYQLVQIYQGKLSLHDLPFQIAIQALWVVTLFFINYFTWRTGIKRYEAFGN